jgi:diguanylate cyclase (GGDEF)-like protein/PAS domain S-box-containing protein
MIIVELVKACRRGVLPLVLCFALQAGGSLAAELTPNTSPPEALRIGVLAFRGPQRALAEWQPHADYLAAKLAPRRFIIVPLTFEEFGAAVTGRKIDLVITNTGHYVELEAGGLISRIATMRIAGPNGPVDRFGGVAIARADRSDISSYADLKGKRVAVFSLRSFGGWQVHLREARAAGLDLTRDLGGVIETQAQDKVVEAVMEGKADAGFVRSDLIESMASAGKLDLASLRIVGARETANFPYKHSTQLYPHWPFARLDHVPEELAKDILIALLSLPPGHPAAVAAGIYGWTLPRNYQSVHELFIEFRLGPYADLPVSLADVMSRYGKPIIGGGFASIAALLAALWAVVFSNRALRRSREPLQLAAGVFEHAQEGILITDAEARIIDANATFLALTGYSRNEILGRNPRFLASGEQTPEFYSAMWQTLTAQGFWRGELMNRRKDGTHYVQQTSISAVKDERGRVRRYIGLSNDISALKESQERLEQMAYFDALTGLPNRRMLSDRLNQAIAQAQRNNSLLAIAYLDLDGFKPVNDTWGHAAGDSLLVEAAKRLMASVRAGDSVSRLGGDEFVVLLGNISHLEECEVALERIRAALSQPFILAEGEANLSASIGVTLYPLDGADPDTLIRHADQAMYLAKQGGRNRYTLFDAEHDRLSEARRDSHKAILDAISNDQLRLRYQPKANMRTGEVIGAEALVRWQHPERGLLHPAEFLPVVEFVGLQGLLGDWVLREALRQLELWAGEGHELVLSINVAADQLQTAGFVDSLRFMLAKHPSVKAESLELEILETAALHDLVQVAGVMETCQALGVSFAIDDFGTGYSSLTYLKQLQAETLKIDQSFVRDMLEDPEDLAIVDGIVGLASAFRRKVVAEGVESVSHGRMLIQLGCDLAQGYGIARPMAAEALPAWIRSWRQPEEWKDVKLWPREDLPLLTVEIDHLRWINLFREAIMAPAHEAGELPPLDPRNCRFGVWLDSTGRDHYGHFPGFPEMEQAHETVHKVGREIEQLVREDRPAARRRLDELLARRDELLKALERLRTQVIASRE